MKNKHLATRARSKTRRAIDRGELNRPDRCERCGEAGPVQAHHDDYANPLDVEFLCASCHGREHADLVSGSDPRSEMLGVRVTPEEKRKIKRLSKARGRPYSDLLREMGIDEAIEEHDRSVSILGGSSEEASS